MSRPEQSTAPAEAEQEGRELDGQQPEAGPRLPPVAYPLLGLLFGGILVWAFSRILLAVSKGQAVAVATLMATNILVGSALVAYGRRVRHRPVSLPLLWGAGLAVVATGIVAMTFGDRGPEGAAEHPPATAAGEARGESGGTAGEAADLVARGTAFLQNELQVQGGGQITIHFDNQDAGIPHNVAVYEGTDATGESIFQGEVFPGPGARDYTFRAPPAGRYFFQCDVHPAEMTGTLVVA